ncbi:hypothetical protein Tco_0704067 [Tanacetum coccineum]|uniref:Uncharacterized protein n=1 Tax=Tanacetum coccineum TaxID=301880 RepID=A0ABQ4Y1J8_9ASTR
MNTTQAQQKALDDALVAPSDRLEFRKCNMRLKTYIKPKEATFQVVLDALDLTPFYQAFLIIAEVPDIYMQEFWAIVSVHKSSITINKKKVSLDVDINLRHTGDITYLTDVNVDYLHQRWRAFATVINKCLSGKETGMDKIRHSPVLQTLVFTKIIIDYFMSKDQSILRRNKMFWHTARDDTMFTSIRYISRHEDTQKADSDTSPKKKPVQATKGTILKTSAKVAKSDKKKQPAKMPKAKGLNVLSKVALTEAEQMKLATKRSKTQFHSSHASGSGDGVDTQSKVPDEQQQKVTGTNEGAGVIPKVLNVPKYDSESEEESWTFSQDDEDAEEERPKVSTPPDYELTKEEENKEDDDKDKEGKQEEEEEEDELYRDLNINLERSDAEMTDAQANQDTEDTHVTLTNVPPVVQQQSSSVSSDLVSKFINPSPDIGIDSILYQDTQSDTLINVPISIAAETPFSVTTISQPPIPNIQPLQQTQTSKTTTTNLTMTLPEIPNFASLFQFDQRLQTNKLKEEAQADNQEFLNQVDSTMKEINKEQVQAQVSKIMPKIEKYVTESLGAEVLVRSTNKPQTSYAVAASLMITIQVFEKGDFKRHRRQDIEDMLLFLVQDKQTNLNLEERYVLNVALRMFTRRIAIQERVKDLQLGGKLPEEDQRHQA